MSRGGSRRGGDRNQELGPDGWTMAGGSGVPRPPAKVGDLSQFGKISKTIQGAPMNLGGPSNFYSKKGERTKEPVRTNMFSALSQGSDAVASSGDRPSRPPSRAENAEAGPSVEAPVRKRLVLQPRTKVDDTPIPPAQAVPDGEYTEEPSDSVKTKMSEDDMKKKIDGDIKEFFHIRNVDDASQYFTDILSDYHHLLVERLVSYPMDHKAADAQLTADLLSKSLSLGVCSQEQMEKGFLPVAELMEEIVIDAPKAFEYLAVMVKGAQLDQDVAQRDRIAEKSGHKEKLISLLS